MAKFAIKDITGVIPAMQTMFDKNEEVDLDATRAFTDFLIEKKVDGLYLTGSTGEGFLMTNEERMAVVKTVCDQVAGRVPVIVHVGDIGTKKSIALAKQAYEAGADAISSVPPFYWNFSENDIYNYYKDLAEATPLPMIVYNIPLAGAMGIDFVAKLSEIENVKGVKYTLTKHHEIADMKDRLGDDFIVYSGCDEMALSGLINGADGIIGSFYNAIPDLFVDIYASFKSGDLETAMKKQRDAVRIISYSVNHQFFSLLRHFLKVQGLDAGYCRRPFKNFSDEEFDALRGDFIAMRDKYSIEGVDFLDRL